MTFAQPHFLYGLLLLLPIILFTRWTNRRHRAALARLGEMPLMIQLSRTVNWSGRAWKARLWLLAVGLAIFALARPQWGSQVQIVEQQGLQLMIALDISPSMLAEDMKPNRLFHAKQAISDLMDQLGGDEVGLVLFSGASFIQFPLTSDYATARSFLENVHPGLISRSGTVIGDAIETARRGFDDQRPSQKVLLILTDGEDHETNPLAAAQTAANNDVRIYTIGFGSAQGEPVPEYNAWGELVGYKQDAQGEMVLSKLEESSLQEIAQVGNGRYFRASSSGREIQTFAAELDTLQQATLESSLETRHVERYQYFLFAAVMAIIISEFIPERKRRLATTS